MKKSLTEIPVESPIPFRTGCNGEFSPPDPTPKDRQAEELFARITQERSKRLGMPRREFVASKMGTAAALLVINQVYGCGDGAGYAVTDEMTEDLCACEPLRGNEFVFDVQTHHVNSEGAWRDPDYDAGFLGFPYSQCGEVDFVDCFDAEHYIQELFVNSETDIAVLSQVPAVPGNSPLENEEAAVTRELINRMAHSQRLIIHGIVLPDMGPEQLDGMQRLKEDYGVAAWKVYTQFGAGWRLDDPRVGIPFIERARELGVKIICAHKGFPIFDLGREFASPADIGGAAALFPDTNFLVYHSGFEADNVEGPYNPHARVGVDTLIKAVVENPCVHSAKNVYAELGSTWRYLMTRPTEAAHVLGKLLLHVGEDNILWGTDSIWYGSPQDQLDAFRAFEIPKAMREAYGYPKLTKRVKAKILGLNAAAVYGIDPKERRCAIQADDVAKARGAIAADANLRKQASRKVGPQNRREFLRFLKAHDYKPL
ncbi:MAG: amidohydrolase 2 [Polyangiaceae bacterium]|jgi:predicted TIM-barrel fold metal-dependent hydrolase|nr:amidohydrolase 2 [Polyangiaceae bacterium]